jgi:hypothetical protein
MSRYWSVDSCKSALICSRQHLALHRQGWQLLDCAGLDRMPEDCSWDDRLARTDPYAAVSCLDSRHPADGRVSPRAMKGGNRESDLARAVFRAEGPAVFIFSQEHARFTGSGSACLQILAGCGSANPPRRWVGYRSRRLENPHPLRRTIDGRKRFRS